MMKKLSVLFLAIMPAWLHGQTALKMGYVDFTKAFEQAQEAQKYTKEIEAEERAIIEGEQKIDVAMDEKGRKFQETMDKLSEAERQKQFRTLSDEFKKQKEDIMKRKVEINQKRQHILTELEQKIRYILNAIAKEKKFDVVFNSATMPYASDEFKKANDITALLVERYNKAYPIKPETKKPAPKTTPAPVPVPQKTR